MKFLFDLGGVFFDWDPNHFYKHIFESENKRTFFLNKICNDEWNVKQDAGRKIVEAEAELITKFPDYENEIKMYYANHRKMIKGTFNSSIKVLEKLKKLNYKCFVLSNWSAETFLGMTEEYSFLKKFDGLLISGEEKLMKPDEKIYNLAITRFELIPNQTIFIDDKLENINTAKKLGFRIIHLIDPNKIEEEIDLLLPDFKDSNER